MEPIHVDNTLLTDVAKCDAMAVVKHVLGLRGTGEKIAADIGNVFHAALEVHFRGKGRAEVLAKLEEEYNKIVPYGEQPESPAHGRENCRKIMGRYCDVRPVERFPFECLSFEETKGIEIAPGIFFYVKRDMLVRDKGSGMCAPLDHKTRHGAITDWWSKKFRMSSQLSGYVWFGQQETGQPVEECYVNALEIKEVPNSGRKCATHKVPYAECGVEHIKFELLTYSRTPEMIEKWKQDAIGLAERFGRLRETFPSVEYLPFAGRNGAFNDSCTFCEVKRWCRVGFRREAAEGLVVKGRWEPWAGAEVVLPRGR